MLGLTPSVPLSQVHFHFDDGSWLREAFTYDWRVWNLDELKQCMLNVGFKKAEVFIDGYDENREYCHDNKPKEDWKKEIEDEDFYSAYIVAHKT